MNDLLDEMEAEAAAAKAEFADAGLMELAVMARRQEIEIKATELALVEQKKRLERLVRYAIPERLSQVGVDEFGFEYEGERMRLRLDVKVVGSLSSAPDEEEAVAYLEQNGLAGGVKSVVEIDFTEDEREVAAVILDEIRALGREPHLIRRIHPQTLAAFVRQKLKDDPSFDYEKVGVRAWTQAKFTVR